MNRAQRRRQRRPAKKRTRAPAPAGDSHGRVEAIDPQSIEALNTRGNALADRGRTDEAIATYRRALAVEPRSLATLNNLGNALRAQGNPDAAVGCYRRALDIDAHSADTHNNLGIALAELGQAVEAVAAYRRALEFNPRHVDACFNLGIALTAAGQTDEAISCYRRAAAIEPGFLPAYVNLGTVLSLQGKPTEAIGAYQQALAIAPGLAEVHYNVGCVLKDQGRLEEAVAAFGRALDIDPNDAATHNSVGTVLRGQGKLGEAVAAFERALDINADLTEARNNLGNVLSDQGRIGDAIAVYERVLAIKPNDAAVRSNLLLNLNFLDDMSPENIFEEHLKWGKAHGGATAKTRPERRHPCAHAKRIRVGYVSPDFRTHSVAYFFEPLLAAHDKAAFEVFCYSLAARTDATTKRLKEAAEHWRSLVGVADEDAARLIREDRIEILVDLAGHTANNRLGIFAAKPAPVQIAWLGYPNTSGLAAIDYRLSDEHADPPGRADEVHSETLIRLDGGFLCYKGNEAAPLIAPLPASQNGYITFGSFNKLSKVRPGVVRVWSEILNAVPDSRLVLKSKSLADAWTRSSFAGMFAEHGISGDRLEMLRHVPAIDDHLEAYARLDVALDPFPYNGTTTTCEALWMGVPVVTLAGERHAGRVGASILNRVGLAELVAESPKAYVEIALGLANRIEELSRLRRALRERVKESPLSDASAFARTVEDAYRRTWRGLGDKKTR